MKLFEGASYEWYRLLVCCGDVLMECYLWLAELNRSFDILGGHISMVQLSVMSSVDEGVEE